MRGIMSLSTVLAALLSASIAVAASGQTSGQAPAPAPNAQTPPAQTPPAQTPPAQTPPAKPPEKPPVYPPPAQPPAAQTPPAQTPPGQAPAPAGGAAKDAPQADKQGFKQEELDQMIAPIALYPDSLLTQVLMAATYPLEVVEAERWVKANKELKGDALAKALEQQKWDPSVKSLVSTPPVLEMMSMKLDWTQKVGDAFISQRAQVMDTVQALRGKAKETGKLDEDKNMKVEVKQEGSKEIIIIESSDPQVIYVPSYNPTVVYGSWAYPAYPPYPYYPPGAMFATFAVGVAWGYAWGGCNWGHSDVDIDVNKNINVNNNIDRSKYKDKAGGRGKESFKHDPSHRKNVPYRDGATAKQFGGTSAADSVRARSDYRGRTSPSAGTREGTGAAGGRGGTSGARPSTGASPGARPSTGATRPSTSRPSGASTGALGGVKSGGASARAQSARGNSSRGGGSRGGGSRGGGGGRRR